MGNYIFIRIIVEILDYYYYSIIIVVLLLLLLCEKYFCFHKILQEHKNIYVYCHCSIVYFYTTRI
jgi:hypothetical protein